MKIKDGFVLREVVGSWMVVPTGQQVAAIHGIISLNETAAEIWKCLENDCTVEEIVTKLCGEYNAAIEEIEIEVEEFLTTLKEKDMLA